MKKNNIIDFYEYKFFGKIVYVENMKQLAKNYWDMWGRLHY